MSLSQQVENGNLQRFSNRMALPENGTPLEGDSNRCFPYRLGSHMVLPGCRGCVAPYLKSGIINQIEINSDSSGPRGLLHCFWGLTMCWFAQTSTNLMVIYTNDQDSTRPGGSLCFGIGCTGPKLTLSSIVHFSSLSLIFFATLCRILQLSHRVLLVILLLLLTVRTSWIPGIWPHLYNAT